MLPGFLGQPNSITPDDNRFELETSHWALNTLTNSLYLEFQKQFFSFLHVHLECDEHSLTHSLLHYPNQLLLAFIFIQSLNITNPSRHIFFYFLHTIPPHTSISFFLYPLPKLSKSPNTSTTFHISNPLPNTPNTPKNKLHHKISHCPRIFHVPPYFYNSFEHIFQTPQNFYQIDVHFLKIAHKATKNNIHNNFFKTLCKHLTFVDYLTSIIAFYNLLNTPTSQLILIPS